MSERKKAPIKKLQDRINSLDFELFKKVAAKILEMAEKKQMTLETLPNSSTISYSNQMMKKFLSEYNIDKETFSEISQVLAFILHELMEDSDAEFCAKIKDAKTLSKVKEFFSFIKQTPEFLPLKARFFVIKYSKSNYFLEIDWEVSIKSSQKNAMAENEFVSFPFSVVKLCVGNQPTPEKRISTRPTIVTMELSLPDAIELSQAFANIAEKLKKLTVNPCSEEV